MDADTINIAKDSLGIVSNVFQLGSAVSDVAEIVRLSGQLGSAIPIVGAILMLIGNWGTSGKHAEILNRFRELSRKIDQVRDDIRNLGNEFGWDLTEHHYRAAVNHIELGMELCVDIGRAIGPNRTRVAKKRLENHCSGNICTLNLNDLMRGMNGNGVLTSSSILDKFDATKAQCHRNRISSMATPLLKVAIEGIMVIATYETMMHGEDEAKHFIEQRQYASQLANASSKAKSILDRCFDNFSQYMLNDLNTFLDTGRPNKDLVVEISNFMADKYDWLENFVLVYNDLYGSDKHCISGDRVNSLHRNDKCGVVYYRRKDEPAKFSLRYNETYQIVDKINTLHAQSGCNIIKAEISKKGIGIIGLAVIERESDLQWGGTLSTKIVTAIGRSYYFSGFLYAPPSTTIYHTKFLLLQ